MILYVLLKQQERILVQILLFWMDTIQEGRFEDTNKIFQNPDKVDFHITEWNDHNHEDIAKEILKNV